MLRTGLRVGIVGCEQIKCVQESSNRSFVDTSQNSGAPGGVVAGGSLVGLSEQSGSFRLPVSRAVRMQVRMGGIQGMRACGAGKGFRVA